MILEAISGARGSHRPGAAGSDRHLIYLHGRIVQEEQSVRPVSQRFGAYELEAIRAAFRDRGFELSSEIRPKGASVSASAERVVAEVRRLIDAGVPAERITIVGASMGASIAFAASARLQNPALRFAFLGACPLENVRAVRQEEGRPPAGRLLVVHEKSDDTSAPCAAWRPEELPPPSTLREVVLETGLGHGFIFARFPSGSNPSSPGPASLRRSGSPAHSACQLAARRRIHRATRDRAMDPQGSVLIVFLAAYRLAACQLKRLLRPLPRPDHRTRPCFTSTIFASSSIPGSSILRNVSPFTSSIA